MKIIAASSVTDNNVFLHAGYMSAYPRSCESFLYPGGHYPYLDVNDVVNVDVAEALRLKGEVLASTSQSIEAGSIVNAFLALGHWPMLLFGTTVFFAMLWLFYPFQQYLQNQASKFSKQASAFVLLLLISLFAVTCGGGYAQAPWEAEDFERKEYEDPEAATKIIIHALAVPAVVNGDLRDFNLASVQDWVGLPVTNLTEGMSYAIKTYGLDGWGNELVVEEYTASIHNADYQRFRVISAGIDGKFGSDDDIVAAYLQQSTNEDFDKDRAPYYIRKDQDDFVVLFPSYDGDHFQFRNGVLATELTGDTLFDCFIDDNLEEGQIEYLKSVYNEVAAEKEYEPLVAQIFEVYR